MDQELSSSLSRIFVAPTIAANSRGPNSNNTEIAQHGELQGEESGSINPLLRPYDSGKRRVGM